MDIMHFGSRMYKSGLNRMYNFRAQHNFTPCTEAESIDFTHIMDMQTQVIIKRLVVEFFETNTQLTRNSKFTLQDAINQLTNFNAYKNAHSTTLIWQEKVILERGGRRKQMHVTFRAETSTDAARLKIYRNKLQQV